MHDWRLITTVGGVVVGLGVWMARGMRGRIGTWRRRRAERELKAHWDQAMGRVEQAGRAGQPAGQKEWMK